MKPKTRMKNKGRIGDQRSVAAPEEEHSSVAGVVRLSRKVLRKQARLFKKAKRNAHASKYPPSTVAAEKPVCQPSVVASKDQAPNSVLLKKKKEKKPQKNPDVLKLERNRKRLLEDNLFEDKAIKELEKKLKINRKNKSKNGEVSSSKKLPHCLVADGLDYLLEVCNMEDVPSVFEANNMSDCDSDFDDDFVAAMGSDAPPIAKPVLREMRTVPVEASAAKRVKLDLAKPSSLLERKCPSADDGATSPDLSAALSASDDDSGEEDVIETMSDIDIDEVAKEEPEVHQQPEKKKPRKSKSAPVLKEDIYGRLRDVAGNIVQNTSSGEKRYVPPALRAKTLNDETGQLSEIVLRLRRQLKGLLNRLSEANMISISNDIEDLYMKNIRNDMNQSLVHLVFEAVVQAALTPERLIQEHAFLIALLHANIGSEVGAHFLESTAKKIDSLMKSGDPSYGVGKESDNALILLTHLYTFQVTNSSLIYDVLRILADRFLEKDVDLILLVLRSAGFILRKDDPAALKEMISILQKKASEASQENIQSRVKFMLETLMAIRNNNMHKIPNYDPTHMDHLRKLLRGVIRKGKSVVELKVSWADLISAESKGRWWIVGSAWKNQEVTGEATKADAAEQSRLPLIEDVSQDIIACARKQRISTEDRKNIFCILMTAQDYVDAFEKLMHLRLKNQQERNIVYVVIDCCLQERTFNCFYAFLMNRFCDTHRKYKIMVQYAVWDRIKELQSATPIQISNFAHLLSRLFLSKGLSLSTLKIIEFADMNKTVVSFLRQILLQLCLHEAEHECLEVFSKVTSQPKYHTFCEGLRLFVELFMTKNKDRGNRLDAEMALKLESRISMVRRILTACETPVKF